MWDLFKSFRAITFGLAALFLTRWLVLRLGRGEAYGIPTTDQIVVALVSRPIAAGIGGFVTTVLFRKNAVVNSLVVAGIALAIGAHYDLRDPEFDSLLTMIICSVPLAVGTAAGILMRDWLSNG